MIINLSSSRTTERLGILLGQFLPAGTTILLQGEVGAGKTTLIQGIGKGLGIEIPIVSPTFTLINEYREGRLPLYHLDLYRLQPTEVAAIYPEIYWEGIEVPLGITAIEWAEHLPYQPANYLAINLIYASYQTRKAEISFVGKEKLALDFLEQLPANF
jgi:tRNA threonylcarbamoyladenosine biosynthesis protein TsaE